VRNSFLIVTPPVPWLLFPYLTCPSTPLFHGQSRYDFENPCTFNLIQALLLGPTEKSVRWIRTHGAPLVEIWFYPTRNLSWPTPWPWHPPFTVVTTLSSMLASIMRGCHIVSMRVNLVRYTDCPMTLVQRRDRSSTSHCSQHRTTWFLCY
jgi:hypothetical protein